jgi:hypothetical protein
MTHALLDETSRASLAEADEIVASGIGTLSERGRNHLEPVRSK